MPIKKPDEAFNDVNPICLLIAGYPGIGKTTLALSAPSPVHIDCDYGVTRIRAEHRKEYLQPKDYDELLDVLTASQLADFQTVVIDTGGSLQDLMKVHFIAKNPAYSQTDGSLSQKGYGAIKNEHARLMNIVTKELRKNLVMIYHAKEEKDGDSTKLRIQVEGATKDNIWQIMDIGGFVEMVGRKRKIGFSNCERYFAKGTHGISGLLDIPELTAGIPNDFLTRLFAQIAENDRKEAAEYNVKKGQYLDIMAQYSVLIDGMTADTIVSVSDALSKAAAALTSQTELKQLFRDKLTALNMKYDGKAKKYVAIPTDADAPQ